MTRKLPIGYWIKQTDLLLTKGVDDIQSSFGMIRTEWQILNSISEKGGIERPDLTKFMSPFADTKSVENVLTKFKIGHLINSDDQKLTLTGKGRELHLQCFEKQNIFRQSLMADISEQDYETTVSTLEKIVKNITPKTI